MIAHILVTLLTVAAFAQELPKAPASEVHTITLKPGYFTEPSIAVNALDPEQVVTAYQDNAHVAYSLDGGKTWQIAAGTEAANYKVSGDVSVTYDKQGHAILCYIAFDKLGTASYWGHNSSRNGIFVRRSLDGGKTWEPNHIRVTEQPNVTPDHKFVPWEDKPYLVADNTNSRYAGNLYIGWTRWTLEDSQIQFSRSTDGGKTWSEPVEIDAQRGLPRDDNGAVEGFSGTVASDGTLYVVWGDSVHILLTSSKDGGAHFSPVRPVVKTAPIMFHLQGLDRANGFPVIAADPRKARTLYLAWSDYRNGDLDVFCASSTDRGQTWGPAVRVNSDPIHNGSDQFFHWLAVDPRDGSVNLVFYDRRVDPINLQQIVVLARSTDAGHTFANYSLTDNLFEAGGVFFGDYTAITALNGRVYAAWTEKPPGQKPPSTPGEPSSEAEKVARPWREGTIIRVGVADFISTKTF
jgi:hypothetical protein